MKQVLVVRTDLKMSAGKAIAQGAHAALGAYDNADRAERDWWFTNGQKKAVLAVGSLVALLNLTSAADRGGLPHYLVRDAGRTELEPDTATVLGIGPGPDDAINELTGELKLYR